MRSPQIIVIGGGAAGFFGAIAAATANPHAQVTLLEAGRQPLVKVSISGGGRCNVTHACFDPALLVQNYPRGGKALRGAFSRFQPRDLVAWFATQDVKLKTEADGRMFPTTDDSATIVDCLTWAAKKASVILRTGAAVSRVQKLPSQENKRATKFGVALKSGEELWCDRLLIATGSSPAGYQIAQNFGHQIEASVPSLFTFNIADPLLRELAGVSVDPVKLQLNTTGTKGDRQKLEQTGALLVTHWGLSGPAVLKLSAWGARALHSCRYHANLQVNWLPQSHPETLLQALQAAKTETPKRAVATYCPVNLPRRLWQYLVHKAEIADDLRWADLSNKAISRLVGLLNASTYTIAGKGVFKEEFVTCGGINLKEVDFKTMESRICKGLYFAGEILDIDGITGGFNFQSAWTTAWLAGQAIANINNL
jgi:predicted Rossmann fold flavoprotein